MNQLNSEEFSSDSDSKNRCNHTIVNGSCQWNNSRHCHGRDAFWTWCKLLIINHIINLIVNHRIGNIILFHFSIFLTILCNMTLQSPPELFFGIFIFPVVAARFLQLIYQNKLWAQKELLRSSVFSLWSGLLLISASAVAIAIANVISLSFKRTAFR